MSAVESEMGTLWSVRRAVRDLRPGDHAWLPFVNEEERRHVVGSFVRGGLGAGEKVVYLAASIDSPVPGVAGRVPSGLLTVVALNDARRPDGHFDPRTILETLGKEIELAERRTHGPIRVTAEMTWAVRRPYGLEQLLGCERQVERMVGPSTRVTTICQFDRGRCRPDELDALRNAHSVQVVADPEFEDPVLGIERTFRPPGLALSGELDASRHAVLDRALAPLMAGNHPSVHLDLSGLSFIDLGALNLLADRAGRRSDGGGLVLDRMSPQLRTVMDAVGWDMLPGLSYGDS
ncbi:MEDS domain-containing protein [Spirillospora sp. CA-294931]|uniref:MEDS domain-containing protein n=1 Tax=Spirillospora sp. CA-294931 TaxID=3240042 RepID=UPI003D92D54D